MKRVNAEYYITASLKGELPVPPKFFVRLAILRIVIAALCLALPLAGLNITLFLLDWPGISALLNILVSIAAVVIVFSIYGRYLIIFFVKLYQKFANPELRERCAMVPSCSVYTILALEKSGIIVGCLRSWRRMRRRCIGLYEVDWPYAVPGVTDLPEEAGSTEETEICEKAEISGTPRQTDSPDETETQNIPSGE